MTADGRARGDDLIAMEDVEVVISSDGRRIRPVKSLMRAIDVLEALAKARRPLGVTELASAVGSSKTAAYNLVTTLEIRGLVRRDSANRYRLGWALFELGELVRADSDFGEAARPEVARLAERTGETVLLGILDQQSIIYTEKAESRRSIRMVESPGQRLPLHNTTAGRVLLAFATAEFRRRYFESAAHSDDAEPFEPDALARRLAEIVTEGYDASYQEREPDLVTVAVPVFWQGSEVIAALVLAGPVSRLTSERVGEYLPLLQQSASTIGRAVGGRSRW